MNYKSSFAKMIYASLALGAACTLTVHYFHLMKPGYWRGVLGMLAGSGVLWIGILSTIALVFVLLYDRPYIRRLVQAKYTFKSVVKSLLLAWVLNACLIFISIIGLEILLSGKRFPLWGQISAIMLFTGGMWCNVTCMYYNYLIGKELRKNNITEP
jgi:hypothetical protein